MTAVVVEVGKKKVFASVVDWPGWCRAGKSVDDALEVLSAYHDRYAEVADAAGIRFLKNDNFEVIEQLPGDASTEFGVPGRVADADREPLGAAGAKRIAALVAGAWQVLDKIAAVTPPELRKGPRGGGRDRDKMLDHVIGAETSYARQISIKHQQPSLGDTAAIEALRGDILAVLSAPSDGSPLRLPKGWPARYGARRIAWHALDHAWEMQDRTE
jgi:hypothetical protein